MFGIRMINIIIHLVGVVHSMDIHSEFVCRSAEPQSETLATQWGVKCTGGGGVLA
uniref:Uncharacterized protein n=1 Tax=Anguilla anguilla TaxID=7936 RepID=A0A0E9XL67_ANGAN